MKAAMKRFWNGGWFHIALAMTATVITTRLAMNGSHWVGIVAWSLNTAFNAAVFGMIRGRMRERQLTRDVLDQNKRILEQSDQLVEQNLRLARKNAYLASQLYPELRN